MLMTPTYWLILGIVLIIIEVTTPGLVSLFFGLAALTVALLAWLVPALGQGWQWIIFSLFSILYLVLLRKTIKKVFSGDKQISDNPNDEYSGKLAHVTEPIAPNRPGRVEFCGCGWTAEAQAEIPAGSTVRIISKKNLTLTVEAV